MDQISLCPLFCPKSLFPPPPPPNHWEMPSTSLFLWIRVDWDWHWHTARAGSHAPRPAKLVPRWLFASTLGQRETLSHHGKGSHIPLERDILQDVTPRRQSGHREEKWGFAHTSECRRYQEKRMARPSEPSSSCCYHTLLRLQTHEGGHLAPLAAIQLPQRILEKGGAITMDYCAHCTLTGITNNEGRFQPLYLAGMLHGK